MLRFHWSSKSNPVIQWIVLLSPTSTISILNAIFIIRFMGKCNSNKICKHWFYFLNILKWLSTYVIWLGTSVSTLHFMQISFRLKLLAYTLHLNIILSILLMKIYVLRENKPILLKYGEHEKCFLENIIDVPIIHWQIIWHFRLIVTVR